MGDGQDGGHPGAGGFDLGAIMKQAQRMQDELSRVQNEVAGKTVEASSGGGMVTVVANGRREVVSIRIEPQAVDPRDVKMLEDLVVAAVNAALGRAQELVAQELSRI